MQRSIRALVLLLILTGGVGCESNCERVIREFLAESCRRDRADSSDPVSLSKNCPAHPDYELIRLKGVITCESGEHWER
jgi:hypothetical protein